MVSTSYLLLSTCYLLRTDPVEPLQHDGMYMYSGSQDMTTRRWRRSDLHCVAVLKGHEKGVLSLKLLGDMLYAGDRKGEIKLWKVGDGAEDHGPSPSPVPVPPPP